MTTSAPLIRNPEGSLDALRTAFAADLLDAYERVGEQSLVVRREAVADVLRALRDDHAYQQLVEIAGVDYPSRPERFEVVYHLLSVTRNHRLRVKVSTDEATPVPTVTTIWPVAGWLEREVFDMYGVVFAGNPDLRRILTDYGFEGHPFRKDFPLTGHVEMRYSEAQGRVVYEPVRLAQDYRDFDFESPWEGATYVLPGDEKAGGTGEAAGKGAQTPLTADQVAKAAEPMKASPPGDPKVTEKPSDTGAGAPAERQANADAASPAPPPPHTLPGGDANVMPEQDRNA